MEIVVTRLRHEKLNLLFSLYEYSPVAFRDGAGFLFYCLYEVADVISRTFFLIIWFPLPNKLKVRQYRGASHRITNIISATVFMTST